MTNTNGGDHTRNTTDTINGGGARTVPAGNSGRDPSPPSNLQHALRLAELGLPVCACKGKSPAISVKPCATAQGGHGKGGYQNRTTDPDTITEWWARHPNANIGYTPADIGCIGLDLDDGGTDAGRQMVALLGQPAGKFRSSGEHRYHLIYPYSGETVKQGQWRWRDGHGDTRHELGILIAWDPEKLIAMLEDKPNWPTPIDPDVMHWLARKKPDRIDKALNEMLEKQEGERNTDLNALTFEAAANGANKAALSAVMLHAAMLAGLPEDEAQDVVQRAISDAPEKPVGTQKDPMTSDADLARELADTYTNQLCYSVGWGWLRWDGQHWARVENKLTREPMEICKQHDIGSTNKIKNTALLAEDMMLIDRDRFNANKEMLNTPEGIIDLRTGSIRPTQPTDYCTRMTPVGPEGECPTWHKFLKEVVPDESIRQYLQVFAGYALTGYTKEHQFIFLYGSGRNGKSTFMNAIQNIMGHGDSGYSMITSPEVFADARYSGHPEAKARLVGARLVVANEISSGGSWNESVIKTMTGGERVTARFMYQSSFDYDPEFSLAITGNHKPSISIVDPAIASRIHLVPFTQFIPEEKRDRDLNDKLLAEAPGILAWAVEGAKTYLANGLIAPTAIRSASNEYMASEDTVQQFIDANIKMDAQASTSSADLNNAFTSWFIEEGYNPRGPSKRIKDDLRERIKALPNVEHGRHGHQATRGYLGIQLTESTSDFPPPPDDEDIPFD